MSEAVQRQVSSSRFAAWIMTGFAVLAMSLAAVGLFAIVAWSVNERTREIGIRLALGASGQDVLSPILGRTLIMTAAGLAAGFGLATAATRMLADYLVDVSPLDMLTFIEAGVMLAVVAAVASLVPARRALRIDPVLALRAD